MEGSIVVNRATSAHADILSKRGYQVELAMLPSRSPRTRGIIKPHIVIKNITAFIPALDLTKDGAATIKGVIDRHEALTYMSRVTFPDGTVATGREMVRRMASLSNTTDLSALVMSPMGQTPPSAPQIKVSDFDTI